MKSEEKPGANDKLFGKLEGVSNSPVNVLVRCSS